MWVLSLSRGRVCRVQLPLALARAVMLGSESLGTRDHILLCQIRDFSSPPTIRRATVEVLTPPPHGASRRETITSNSSSVIICFLRCHGTYLPNRCASNGLFRVCLLQRERVLLPWLAVIQQLSTAAFRRHITLIIILIIIIIIIIIIQIQFRSVRVYLRADLTAQRPVTKLARVRTKTKIANNQNTK
jgi:hypothetical protein